MKRLLLIIALLLAMFANALAQSTYVRGYYRKDGTYVKGYYRKVRNHTNHDNDSTFANTNPHTGSRGTRARDYSPAAYNYGGGRTIYIGPRGGQYYINSKGRKVYVPKRR